MIGGVPTADDTDIRFETHIEIPSHHYRFHVCDSHLRNRRSLAATLGRREWRRAQERPRAEKTSNRRSSTYMGWKTPI